MRTHKLFPIVLSFLVAGVGVLVACSDDSSTNSTSSSGSASDTVTVRMTAATGGTISDKGGKATLSVPPGALEKDTEITLKVSPASGGAVGDVYDFGPDGLKFLKPSTLVIKADAALAPAGKSLAVAIEEGGKYKALTGSKYENGVATGTIEHFTKFSLVVVDGQVTLVDPTSCQDARTKFVACGGDPKGAWLFADFCPDPTSLPKDPLKDKCAQYTLAVDMTSTREVTIDATTLGTGPGKETVVLTGTFPASCFADDGGTPTCDSFNDPAESRTCTDKGSGMCECTETTVTDKPDNPKSDTYTTDSATNTITFTNKDGKVTAGEYCVSGDILYFKEKPQDGKVGLLYVLKRK